MKNCPKCEGPVALRCYDLTEHDYPALCPHPCHHAAKAVVEAAEAVYGEIDGLPPNRARDLYEERRLKLGSALAALAEALEQSE